MWMPQLIAPMVKLEKDSSYVLRTQLKNPIGDTLECVCSFPTTNQACTKLTCLVCIFCDFPMQEQIDLLRPQLEHQKRLMHSLQIEQHQLMLQMAAREKQRVLKESETLLSPLAQFHSLTSTFFESN